MKDKTSAGLLALFVGGFGVHKFYLGRPAMGILYLIFFWTLIPALVSFVEAILLFTMSNEDFNAKYNGGMAMALAAPQNIVVNVANTATSHATNRVTQIRELHSLLTEGAISPDEYEMEKRRLLTSGA